MEKNNNKNKEDDENNNMLRLDGNFAFVFVKIPH